ncbi:MAG: hypothetical protein GY765_43100 [bacterium]|nr:hypothetical protein [bacterium]
MALKFSNLPDNALKALKKGLKIVPEKKHARLLRVKKKDIGENTPHKVYILDLDEILSGEAFKNPKHVSWRYITEDHMIEVQLGENEGEFEFTEINQGMHIKDILDKLEIMRKHAKIKTKDYEVSIVMVPALYVMALWLQGEGEIEDIVIPVGLSHPHLCKHPKTMFSPAEFVKILTEAAKQRVAFDDSPS